MHERLSIELLASVPQAIPVLCEWFEAQWPAYYGPGGRGSALRDLRDYAHQGSLPVGVVALEAGVLGLSVHFGAPAANFFLFDRHLQNVVRRPLERLPVATQVIESTRLL